MSKPIWKQVSWHIVQGSPYLLELEFLKAWINEAEIYFFMPAVTFLSHVIELCYVNFKHMLWSSGFMTTYTYVSLSTYCDLSFSCDQLEFHRKV